MSFSTLLFLGIRALHVLLAATWLGGVGFMVFFVMPALKETGPGAAPMMSAIARRGLRIYLYWRLTGRFDPALSATRTAMVFGTGGIAGILSVILDGAVVGRNMKRMGDLGGKAMALPEGSERGGLTNQLAAARDRAITGARIVLALQMVALICMAIGHYV